MAELKEVKGNLDTMKRHSAFLNIKDVIEVTDSQRDGMDRALKQIEQKCVAADLSEGQTKLLVYVYVATHGIMYDGATKT